MFHVGFSFGASPLNNSVLRMTVSLLVAFSFVITCRLLAGDSFSCHDPESKIPQSHLNMLCYSGSVYIEQHSKDLDDRKSEQDNEVSHKRYATHYAWVNLMLLAQAFLFCLPHLLWKNLKKGYLKKMPFLSHGFSIIDSERDLKLLVGNLKLMKSHWNYAICNNLMHLENFIVVILQAVWLFRFFQIDEMSKVPAVGSDSMSRFSELHFPQSGHCDVRRDGDSADTSVKCLLPLNQLYLYIFLFLRGWYVLLVLVCALNVLFIVLMRSSRRLRLFALSHGQPLHVLKSICHQMPYHDWFIMKQLSGKLSDAEFKKLADILSYRLSNDPSPLLRKKTIPPESELDSKEEADSNV